MLQFFFTVRHNGTGQIQFWAISPNSDHRKENIKRTPAYNDVYNKELVSGQIREVVDNVVDFM